MKIKFALLIASVLALLGTTYTDHHIAVYKIERYKEDIPARSPMLERRLLVTIDPAQFPKGFLQSWRLEHSGVTILLDDEDVVSKWPDGLPLELSFLSREPGKSLSRDNGVWGASVNLSPAKHICDWEGPCTLEFLATFTLPSFPMDTTLRWRANVVLSTGLDYPRRRWQQSRSEKALMKAIRVVMK